MQILEALIVCIICDRIWHNVWMSVFLSISYLGFVSLCLLFFLKAKPYKNDPEILAMTNLVR